MDIEVCVSNPFITTTNEECVNDTIMLWVFFVPSDIFYCFG